MRAAGVRMLAGPRIDEDGDLGFARLEDWAEGPEPQIEDLVEFLQQAELWAVDYRRWDRERNGNFLYEPVEPENGWLPYPPELVPRRRNIHYVLANIIRDALPDGGNNRSPNNSGEMTPIEGQQVVTIIVPPVPERLGGAVIRDVKQRNWLDARWWTNKLPAAFDTVEAVDVRLVSYLEEQASFLTHSESLSLYLRSRAQRWVDEHEPNWPQRTRTPLIINSVNKVVRAKLKAVVNAPSWLRGMTELGFSLALGKYLVGRTSLSLITGFHPNLDGKIMPKLAGIVISRLLLDGIAQHLTEVLILRDLLYLATTTDRDATIRPFFTEPAFKLWTISAC